MFLGCSAWALDLLLFGEEEEEEGCVGLVPQARNSIARCEIEGFCTCNCGSEGWEY